MQMSHFLHQHQRRYCWMLTTLIWTSFFGYQWSSTFKSDNNVKWRMRRYKLNWNLLTSHMPLLYMGINLVISVFIAIIKISCVRTSAHIAMITKLDMSSNLHLILNILSTLLWIWRVMALDEAIYSISGNSEHNRWKCLHTACSHLHVLTPSTVTLSIIMNGHTGSGMHYAIVWTLGLPD